ncbi:hypothetical protein C8Q72DRAFT_862303 [Fomitopsis betulina]|nr:hypothetical protein C8Q72DRAFT_862303 [Fomitopsis betulina]
MSVPLLVPLASVVLHANAPLGHRRRNHLVGRPGPVSWLGYIRSCDSNPRKSDHRASSSMPHISLEYHMASSRWKPRCTLSFSEDPWKHCRLASWWSYTKTLMLSTANCPHEETYTKILTVTGL